jgi:hypothetical protein
MNQAEDGKEATMAFLEEQPAYQKLIKMGLTHDQILAMKVQHEQRKVLSKLDKKPKQSPPESSTD